MTPLKGRVDMPLQESQKRLPVPLTSEVSSVSKNKHTEGSIKSFHDVCNNSAYPHHDGDTIQQSEATT